ncbi:hypothetical protein JRQ81_003043 [Phrynocephalus forsythii]|uniref:Uncharacterized protein n=1 Tax=Phrynocephalus forsythii TaxID=171643 RepID=A0A9Q0XJR3_9SAUR|nr:hypothetical protein JRQ81_003043 [Phrynocephalus forsythii]
MAPTSLGEPAERAGSGCPRRRAEPAGPSRGLPGLALLRAPWGASFGHSARGPHWRCPAPPPPRLPELEGSPPSPAGPGISPWQEEKKKKRRRRWRRQRTGCPAGPRSEWGIGGGGGGSCCLWIINASALLPDRYPCSGIRGIPPCDHWIPWECRLRLDGADPELPGAAFTCSESSPGKGPEKADNGVSSEEKRRTAPTPPLLSASPCLDASVAETWSLPSLLLCQAISPCLEV